MCIPLMYRKAYMQDAEKAHRGVIASLAAALVDNLFDYPGVIVMNGAWNTPSTICSQ